MAEEKRSMPAEEKAGREAIRSVIAMTDAILGQPAMPEPPSEVRALDVLHRQAMREEKRGRALEEVGKTLLGAVENLRRSLRRRRPRPSKRDNRHYVPADPKRTAFRKLSEAEKDLIRTVAARIGRSLASFGEPPIRIWSGPVSGKAVRRYLTAAPSALNGFKLGGLPLSAALEVAQVAYVIQGRDQQFTVCLLRVQPDAEDGETILVGVAHRDRRDLDNYGVGLRLALAHAVEGRSGAATPGEDIESMAWAAERAARVSVVRPREAVPASRRLPDGFADHADSPARDSDGFA